MSKGTNHHSGTGERKEAPNALRRGPVHEIRGWRWWVFWPGAWALDLYYRSLRIRFRPEEAAALAATTGPRLIVAWHNRSLVFPCLVQSLGRDKIHTLISASRMAAWEVAYYAHRGLPAIRGSSTRGGALAVKNALRILRSGGDLAVGPDGPSGPLYSFQRGVAMIARHTGVPIVLIGAECPKAYRLRSWDRHLMPWPGQVVNARVRIIPHYDALNASNDEEACARLRAALLEINQE